MQERFALSLQSVSVSTSANKTPVAAATSEPIASVAASAAASTAVISDTLLGNVFLASAAGVKQPAVEPLATNTHTNRRLADLYLNCAAKRFEAIRFVQYLNH